MRKADERPDQVPGLLHVLGGLDLASTVAYRPHTTFFILFASDQRIAQNTCTSIVHGLTELTERLFFAGAVLSRHVDEACEVIVLQCNLEMMSRLMDIPSDSLLTVPSLRKTQGTAC